MTTNKNSPSKIFSTSASYTDRVVGFIDILGFADLVKRADRDSALRAQIVEALEKVRSVASPTGGETDLRAQNFSDSLILSARDTPDGLWHLLLAVDALAWNLLQIGVLIRGGITIGCIHHDEHVVFGIGVNEAYRLESVVAKVPRIVLGIRAVEAAKRYAITDEIWETYRNSRLLRDRDGVYYLNYLTELSVFNRQDPQNPDMLKHPMYAVGQSLKQIIQKKIEEILDQPDVYAKVAWLAQYWNAEVAAPRPDGHNPILGPIVLAGEEPRTAPLPFRSL